MEKQVVIKELLCNSTYKYSIPLYQRNFAWTDMEITQLIIDILDSIKEKKLEYYIGTLVICKNDSDREYDIIDGQQRFTAILLICMAIQNKYSIKGIENLNLCFRARKKSNDTLEKLLNNNINACIENELLDAYKITINSLKENIVDKKDYIVFYNYLLNNVKIFIDEMPEETDVNLYFERFNSRGEQLESHEIIKAELMQKMLNENCDISTVQKFAKLWDACSEFETPVIKFFKKKTLIKDDDDEREKIFNCIYNNDYKPGNLSRNYSYDIQNIYDHILINDENKQSLLYAIDNKESDINNNEENNQNDEFNKYRCIVNFNYFLLYVLYITDNIASQDIQLDDKKLQELFNIKTRNKDWILNFGENLLKTKFIFDNLIIRNSLETTGRQREGEWFLQKAYMEGKNDKRGGRLYVQTRFDKNSFRDKNDEILMLQSMFAVTFTAYKDTKWLFTTLKYLFDKGINLNNDNFGEEFNLFLERLLKQYAIERIIGNDNNVDKNRLRYDNNVSIFAFNLMDYVIWKKKDILTTAYPTIKFNKFKFTYRRSIEHWYPQNPNGSEGKEKMDEKLLHSFGNLCIVVASQNSKFGNSPPNSKLDTWKSIFGTQSLKLQMMAKKTKDWNGWDEAERNKINDMETELINLLNEYLISI